MVPLVPQEVHSSNDLKRKTLPLRAKRWERRLPKLKLSALVLLRIRRLQVGKRASEEDMQDIEHSVCAQRAPTAIFV